MITGSSNNDKVDIFLDINEKFDELCFNQFIIKFNIADIERINNSIKQLEMEIERLFIIADIAIEDEAVAFYCDPNGLNTSSGVEDLESAVIWTVKEIRDDLFDIRIPYEIHLIVDGIY